MTSTKPVTTAFPEAAKACPQARTHLRLPRYAQLRPAPTAAPKEPSSPSFCFPPRASRFDQKSPPNSKRSTKSPSSAALRGVTNEFNTGLADREVSIGDTSSAAANWVQQSSWNTVTPPPPGPSHSASSRQESLTAPSRAECCPNGPDSPAPQEACWTTPFHPSSEFRGLQVPEVLISGDHDKIRAGAGARPSKRRSRTGLTCWRAGATKEDREIRDKILAGGSRGENL